MEDGSLPSYLFLILIILIMVFNGLVVACKRALDYIDRNVIKDMLEDEPENKRLQTVTDFLAKPSKYHYADHAASFISIIVCFILFNVLLIRKDILESERFSLLIMILLNLGFYVVYTGLSDILPKKLAAQSSEAAGIGLIGFQKFIYIITLPLVWICKAIANLILRIMGKNVDVDDSYFSEDKVMSMLDRG